MKKCENDAENMSRLALDKLCELVSCGDKRIELASAKEVLSLLGLPELALGEQAERLEVEINVEIGD